MDVLFRADGGPDIGYGHLVRTGALAAELLARGHDVTYATTTPEAVETTCPDAVETVSLPARANPEPCLAHIDRLNPDLVFTDAYPVDTAYQRALREHVPLAVHQDDARHSVAADLFFNWNLYGPDLDYEFVGPTPRTCLGSDYVPLRASIRDLATRDPVRRETPTEAVVTMGGSDVAGLTAPAVRAFDGTDVRVVAVVGPGVASDDEATIRTAAEDASADIEVVRDPPDLPRRLFEAGFAVTTAGSTVYELLALGTPFASRPVVDNQAPIAGALRRREAATVLDRTDGEAEFREAIVAYLRDAALRADRQRRGRTLVDGRGTARVTAELLSLTP